MRVSLAKRWVSGGRKREIPHFLLKFSKNSTFRTSGPKRRDRGGGYVRAAGGIGFLHLFDVFLAKKCTFGPFRAPRGAPPAGPSRLALSVEGRASDGNADPLIGGPGL